MTATAKVRTIRETMKLENAEERSAWVAFAAAAAMGVAGENDKAGEDAREAAQLADAMLVQMRRRT
jgi:hypothetical protein